MTCVMFMAFEPPATSFWLMLLLLLLSVTSPADKQGGLTDFQVRCLRLHPTARSRRPSHLIYAWISATAASSLLSQKNQVILSESSE